MLRASECITNDPSHIVPTINPLKIHVYMGADPSDAIVDNYVARVIPQAHSRLEHGHDILTASPLTSGIVRNYLPRQVTGSSRLQVATSKRRFHMYVIHLARPLCRGYRYVLWDAIRSRYGCLGCTYRTWWRSSSLILTYASWAA
eukprot:SAG31_NODE_330_length_17593_cov_4.817891_26_plen_145_part_00